MPNPRDGRSFFLRSPPLQLFSCLTISLSCSLAEPRYAPETVLSLKPQPDMFLGATLAMVENKTARGRVMSNCKPCSNVFLVRVGVRGGALGL